MSVGQTRTDPTARRGPLRGGQTERGKGRRGVGDVGGGREQGSTGTSPVGLGIHDSGGWGVEKHLKSWREDPSSPTTYSGPLRNPRDPESPAGPTTLYDGR